MQLWSCLSGQLDELSPLRDVESALANLDHATVSTFSNGRVLLIAQGCDELCILSAIFAVAMNANGILANC